jgi:hypothetical protein
LLARSSRPITPSYATARRAVRAAVRQHCVGALIPHEKLGKPNWRIRFAHACGLYNPARLDLTAPVVDTIGEFLTQTSADRRHGQA